MMMKFRTRINSVLFLSLLWACQPGLAKDYVVEMIFFANTSDPEQPLVPSDEPWASPDLPDAVLLDDSALLRDFLPLPREELKLTRQAFALAASDKYRILEHAIWLQPGLAKRQAIPVRIRAGLDYSDQFGEPEPLYPVIKDPTQEKHPINELDGTVKVVLGRYLHVFTDLVYRRPLAKDTDTEPAAPDPLGHDRVLADFPLKAHRKMRSKELHYIDHPLFGILVEIRPAESEDETS